MIHVVGMHVMNNIVTAGYFISRISVSMSLICVKPNTTPLMESCPVIIEKDNHGSLYNNDVLINSCLIR
jgi:hypothetical protein